MTLLQWKDEYRVGIEAVDHEHRHLIDLINRLHATLGTEGAKPAVSAFFGDLLQGISSHFALEEKLMRDYGYDQLKRHKDDHECLLDELRELMDAFDQSEQVDNHKLAQRLDAWFSRHFRTLDAEFHRAFEARDARLKGPIR